MLTRIKDRLFIRVLICVILPLVLCGCGSLTKTVNPQTGATVFSPSTAWSNTVAQVQAGIQAVPNEIPYAPIGKDIALGLLGLATGVLTLVAKAKSSALADQTKAADLLAATVVKANQTQAALTSAINDPNVNTDRVKEHLDKNTL